MRTWSRILGVTALCYAVLGSGAVQAATAQVRAGENHTVMLRPNGSIWACGDNSLGQLGDGTQTDRSQVIRIGTATDWAAISAGMHHTVAIKADGTLWAWGDNIFGQLGTGQATLVQTTPVQVGTDTNWKAVSAGDYHTLALNTKGEIWAWGDSADGTLGTGETYSGIILSVPTQVGADTDWVAVASGHDHTMAVKSNGTLWAWGSNGSTQLGDQTNLEARAPIRVGTDSDWADVTARGSKTVARKTDGKLFTWGLNLDGQLGDGTFANKDIPTKVDDNKWVAIASGQGHTVALKDDGSLWAWGDNAEGQCGGGDAKKGEKRNLPLQISTARDFVAVEAGEVHTVAMKANGTLWGFGGNTLGQLCNGSNTARTDPFPGISPTSGDMDLNGDVSVADAIHALKVVVGVKTPGANDLIVAPQASASGAFSITDPLLILNKVVGLPVNF